MNKLNVIFVIFLLISRESSSFSCNKEECSCVDYIVICINVFHPSFFYRPSITVLYMRGVQLNGITHLIRLFPNLGYITLLDMVYFNCKWIDEIPSTITVFSNNCITTKTGKYFTNSSSLFYNFGHNVHMYVIRCRKFILMMLPFFCTSVYILYSES